MRYAFAIVLAVFFAAPPPGTPLPTAPARGSPLREVSSQGVEVLVPRGWEVRRIGEASLRRGVAASADLDRFDARRSKAVGVEAYWVDAPEVGVPSDYYYLAARGPAMSGFTARKRCRATESRIVLDKRPRLARTKPSVGSFVAVSSGTCRTKQRGHRTRWASFVAAPGFGPMRELGIPASGMYSAVVMLEDAPGAREDIDRLLYSIRFGGTSVADFVATAETAGRPL